MALLNAGIAAQSAGRLPEATSDYQKVLAKDPNNFWALYDLGVIEQASAKSATAESYYRRALTINPAFVPALYNLAIIRTPVNPQEAEALYRSAIAAQPGAATSHLNLGFLLLHEGKQADGQAELRLAVKYDPSLAARVPAAILSPAASHKP